MDRRKKKANAGRNILQRVAGEPVVSKNNARK
jgi:hypothetical protein